MKTTSNKVELTGFLGKDPEMKNLKSGRTLIIMSLATNESYQDKSGEWVKNTQWHHVVFWKELPEDVKRHAKKGACIFVEGKLNYNRYTDKQGNVRYNTQIVGQNVKPVISSV